MSRVRDAIREQTRFARMRMGQEVAEPVEIPSMRGIRIGIVPLTEAESQQGLVAAAELEVPDNAAGINARNRLAAQYDVWNACRDLDTPSEKIWSSLDEMLEDLQPTDIDVLFDHLSTLQEYASPSFANLSDKQVDDLKKGFAALDWRGLYGKQASALVLCISRLLPELLAASTLSTGSTSSSTLTSESEESIPNALTS